MTNIILLAIGVYWIVAGLRVFFAPAATRALIDVFEDNQAVTFFGGVILLIAGVAVLSQHNLWSTQREGFASLVVWVATIEGALMIAAPGILFGIGRKMIPSDSVFRLIGLALIPLGAAVIYFWA